MWKIALWQAEMVEWDVKCQDVKKSKRCQSCCKSNNYISCVKNMWNVKNLDYATCPYSLPHAFTSCDMAKPLLHASTPCNMSLTPTTCPHHWNMHLPLLHASTPSHIPPSLPHAPTPCHKPPPLSHGLWQAEVVLVRCQMSRCQKVSRSPCQNINNVNTVSIICHMWKRCQMSKKSIPWIWMRFIKKLT